MPDYLQVIDAMHTHDAAAPSSEFLKRMALSLEGQSGLMADALINPKPDTTTATWHPTKPLGTHLALGPNGT
jgi:hypothetical protein